MICGDCGRELTLKSLEGTHRGKWLVCESCDYGKAYAEALEDKP